MILPLSKNYVVSQRIGTRADRPRGPSRLGTSMDSHLAEVSAKAGLEKAELIRRQRLPSTRRGHRAIGTIRLLPYRCRSRSVDGQATEIVIEARRRHALATSRARLRHAGRRKAGKYRLSGRVPLLREYSHILSPNRCGIRQAERIAYPAGGTPASASAAA
jgi:hypothetical protein